MNIILLILSSLLLLSVGFYFVIRGLKSADDDDVVPISDVKEIRAISNAYVPEEGAAKGSEPSLTSHIVKEAINSPAEETFASLSRRDDVKINSLTKEIEMLRGQLKNQEQESQKKLENIISERGEVEEAPKGEKSSDDEALDVTPEREEISKEFHQKLIDENDRLRVQLIEKDRDLTLAEEEREAPEVQERDPSENIEEVRKTWEDKIDELVSENRELMAENKAIGRIVSEKTEMEAQLARHKQVTDELEGQLNVLGEELEELKNRSVGTEQNLMVENKALTAQVMERENLVNRLRDEIETLRTDIEAAHEETLKLEGQAHFLSEGESKPIAKEILEENEKLKKFNQSLIERETLLQYDLTKSKAQSVGFEKICEELKVQVEKTSNSSSKD